MKVENVLRVLVIMLIGLFVCISIDFGMVWASARSSVSIANSLIPTVKSYLPITNENDVETNYSESVKDHNRDFVDLNISRVDNEGFTPSLYRWLWKENATQ